LGGGVTPRSILLQLLGSTPRSEQHCRRVNCFAMRNCLINSPKFICVAATSLLSCGVNYTTCPVMANLFVAFFGGHALASCWGSADILVGPFAWPHMANMGTRRLECRRSAGSQTTRAGLALVQPGHLVAGQQVRSARPVARRHAGLERHHGALRAAVRRAAARKARESKQLTRILHT